MARDEERMLRAQQAPIVGGLPDVPGIGVAMRLTPGLGVHLRGLADELLVNDFPGATIRRDQRETLATAVSAANDCFFCMDSHGAFASALLERSGATELRPLIETVKSGSSDGFDPKMQALLHIARTVRRDPLLLTPADVEAATAAGATDGDVQLAVLIASAFSMYNRMVDGFRARTAPVTEVYAERASEIAANGYSAPSAIPAPSDATGR
jgi:AhpD family alkylhydroperoxidase